MQKLFLPLIAALTLTACTSEEAQIKQEIAKANYCDVPADCVQVGSKCPFDCYIYANTAEADRIRGLVEGFQSTCEYGCMQSFGVACENNKCVAITRDPAGNVGASCEADEHCVTPMNYLTRSVCPFSSRCINGACAVVCPMVENNPQATGIDPVQCEQDADCDCSSYPPTDMKKCSCVNNECVSVVQE